jgi:hypothetical protein
MNENKRLNYTRIRPKMRLKKGAKFTPFYMKFKRIMRLGRTIYNQRKWEENKITGGRTGAIL